MVRPVLAMPRVMAWRIHQVAYVENLKPLRQSNFSTACMRPRFPSWIRSSSGRPEAWYFLAIETTRRRLDWTKVCWACSPWITARRSSRRFEVVVPLGALRSSASASPATLDGLGQPDLVVLGEQGVLPDVGQIEPYEVFVVSFDTFLCQGLLYPPVTWGIALRAVRWGIYVLGRLSRASPA
jgi:hypothetical protein